MNVMKCLAVVGMIALGASSAAQAETINVTANPVATPGLSGYQTWTVTLTSDTDPIIAINATFTADSMNQVNPAGNSTVFEDSNPFFTFVGADPAQDSQFLFKSTDLTIPAGASQESDTLLTSGFTFPGGPSSPLAGLTIPLAQIVLPVGDSATFVGQIVPYDTATQTQLPHVDVTSTFGGSPVPEPASLALLGLGGLLIARRRATEPRA